jgi:expansin (peptidoglycan-binding protein)
MNQLFLLILIFNLYIKFSHQNNYNIKYQGDITTYGGQVNGGSCGFKSIWSNMNMNFKYGLAINAKQYNNSLSCGKCINIQYNNRNINAMVTDICPECKFGDLDLFTETYNTIIQDQPDRKFTTWNFIECPNNFVDNNIQLRVDEINYYWLSIQPENFKCGISSISIYQNNNWIEMSRQDSIMMGLYFIYNHKIEIPFKFKIKNEFNEEIITEEYSQIINLFKLNKQFYCNNIDNSKYNEIVITQDPINNNIEFDCN